MSKLWLLPLGFSLAAAMAPAQSASSSFSFNLTGTGSGSGRPGLIDAHLHEGTLTIGGGGRTTTIPLSFVAIDGNGSTTNIGLIPAGNANDYIHFYDGAASLNNLGRTGTASISYGIGAFHFATGTIAYSLVCTFVCFNGNGTPTADIFAFSFTASGTLNLPTTTAQAILPALYPPPPPTPGVVDTIVSIYTFITNPSSALGKISVAKTEPHTSSGAGGELFSMALPWETVPATFSASTTCPGSPTDCWISTTTPTGTIAPFSNTSISLSLNAGSLGNGVYPADFSLTLTPSGSAPTTSNLPFTLLVTNGDPLLQVSETGVQLHAITGGPSPALHSISVSSTGAAISYSATASTLAGGNWLTVTQASGTASSSSTGTLYISANSTGLAAGSYFGRIDIAAPGAFKALQSIEVELTVAASAGSVPTLSSTGLIFVASQGTNPQPQVVTVSTLSSTPIAMTGMAAANDLSTWLSASSSSTMTQASQPLRETLSINTKGLMPGVYSGTLYEEVTATSVVYPVTVTLIVTPPSGSTCTPTQLLPVLTSFGANFELAAALPVSVTAQIVDDCGSPLNSGSVQAVFSTGDPALMMIPIGAGQWSASWNPHALAGGAASVAINAESLSGLAGSTSAAGTLDANPTATVITQGGVVNAAALISGAPVAPGEFISIFGSNLAPSTTSSESYPYLTSLAGTQVLLGGQPLPLEFVSSGQINALVPYGTPVNGLQDLQVTQNGTYSFAETIVVAAANPAVFTQAQSGQGAGVIVVVKADGTQFEASATEPATAGDALVIYCSGLGAVSPPVADGAAAPLSTLSKTANPVTVTIGGQSAQVLFAGLAPGFAGLYQVNAIVPPGITADANVPVVLTTAEFSSPAVTVAIH